MDTSQSNRRISRAWKAGLVIVAAIFMQVASPQTSLANTVATINVTQGEITASGTVYHNEIVGVGSTLNGSAPARVVCQNGEWDVSLPDYYVIQNPAVEPYRAIRNDDGSIAMRGMNGLYSCSVTTFSGNEIILTLRKTSESGPDSFTCEIEGITWYDGESLIDVSHLWDGIHRESSTWFYFDEGGKLVTL